MVLSWAEEFPTPEGNDRQDARRPIDRQREEVVPVSHGSAIVSGEATPEPEEVRAPMAPSASGPEDHAAGQIREGVREASSDGPDDSNAEWLPYRVKSLAYLSRLIDEMGGSSVDQFADRIKIQKKVYLAQELFHVKLGYSFQWYPFGPYSRSLAEECGYLDALGNDARKVATVLEFKPDVQERLKRVREFGPPSEFEADELAWLELASSVHMVASLHFRKLEVQDLTADQRKQVEEELFKRKPRLAEGLNGSTMSLVWASLEDAASSST